jgi:hypothetical protein
MKKTFSLFLVFIALVAGYDTMAGTIPDSSLYANDLHQIRQIEGTNKNIVNFFNRAGILFYTDTIYCIIIPPMKCSRCEGVINPFIFELKKLDPEATVIVFTFYPKTGALKHYLEQRQFRADYTLAAPDDSFLENFNFSTEEIQVPFIAKFNIHSGDMIVGKSTLGLDMNKDFVRRIRAFDKTARKHKAGQAGKDPALAATPVIKIKDMNLPVSTPRSELLLGEEEGYPISRVLFPAINDELSYFSFMDELSYTIYLYSISDGCMIFVDGIAPDSRIERLFIDENISDTLLLLLKKMNIINSMFFSSTFVKDSIIVTSSLPFIFFEDSIKERLAYFNRSTYLFRGTEEDSITRFIVPSPLPDSNFTLEHLSTQFINEGQLIFLPVSKGWPVSGTQLLNEISPEDNPFLPAFYDRTPTMAVYDNNGRFKSYFGNLPDEYIKNKLGYAYSRPMVTFNNGIFWYADKYLGKIYGIKNLKHNKPSYRLDVFKTPDYTSDINPVEKPLEYIKDYRKVYTQSLMDFKVYNDTVYVISQHDELYLYKKFSIDGELLSTTLLPTVYDNMNASHFILNCNDHHQWLIGIYESASLTSLYLFK